MNPKTYAAMLVVAFSAGFFGGMASNPRASFAQEGPEAIQVARIDAVDQTGKVRIRLATNPQTGKAGLSIFDATSNSPRILIGELADGTNIIQLQDVKTNKVSSFDLLPGGTSRLADFNSSPPQPTPKK